MRLSAHCHHRRRHRRPSVPSVTDGKSKENQVGHGRTVRSIADRRLYFQIIPNRIILRRPNRHRSPLQPPFRAHLHRHPTLHRPVQRPNMKIMIVIWTVDTTMSSTRRYYPYRRMQHRLRRGTTYLQPMDCLFG